jgi:methyl-accepting chemotaxis protein
MLRIRSLRLKMLVPALAAVLATVVAMIVTWSLSKSAENQLTSTQARKMPAMVFLQDLHADLGRLNALMLYVGESDAYATLMSQPETLFYDMLDRLEKQGPAVLGEAHAKALKAELEKYYDDGDKDAAKRVANRVKFKAERAKRPDQLRASGTTIEEQAALARSQEVDDEYQRLYKRLADEARAAKDELDRSLAAAVEGQRNSILAGALILIVAAVGGALFAWLISGATARPVRNLSEVALRIAQGDLTPHVLVESDDEIGALARSFQQMVTRLRELVATLKAASEEMATAAEQLSDHTRAQSAMLERQASGVAETSSTTRELEQSSSVAASRAAAVLDVARRAGEMSEAGRTAAEESAGELRRIQGSVEGIVNQSSLLLDQARQVGDIVETVRDLATQSHVLSLNASIEAAKAGEAGKSFAVVAQEVRALAEQSGHGATRIGKMVEDILSAVHTTREMTERGSHGMAGSLDRIRASGESLREIGVVVRETSDAALHIASAVQQQSSGITQIAMAMRDLDKGMEETVGRIRALEVSAQQVAETATRISGVAAEFRL